MKHLVITSNNHYQLLVVVGGEVPDVNGAALVPHNEGGLVWVETHTVHRSIHLEEPLTLLAASSGKREGGRSRCVISMCIWRKGERRRRRRGEEGRRKEREERKRERGEGKEDEGREGEPLHYLRSHILAIQSSPPEYM